MNEKELGKALLRWDALQPPGTPEPDPRVLTARIIDRDKRLVRWLAGFTVLLWLLAATGICGLILFYLLFIEPKYQSTIYRIEKHTGVDAGLVRASLDLRAVSHMSINVMALSLGAMGLAAILTVLLVVFSRRATLRQINANLIEVAEQLKQLREALAKEPARSG
jgi:hypothetical protein